MPRFPVVASRRRLKPRQSQAEKHYDKFVKLTVREALRDAMAEEMRRDPNVFLMGEEVAQYQGAYKVSQGLLQEFGDKRVIDTPDHRNGFCRSWRRRGVRRLAPDRRIHDHEFRHAGDGPDHQFRRQDVYMSGGQMGCPIVFRGPNGAASRVAAQHSQCYASWYAHIPGLKVVAPYDAADAKGLIKSAIRDLTPSSSLKMK